MFGKNTRGMGRLPTVSQIRIMTSNMVVEGQGAFCLTPITAGYIACSVKGVVRLTLRPYYFKRAQGYLVFIKHLYIL